MNTPKRVPRDIANLVSSLRSHLSLLREYSTRAFQNGEVSFLGEVAGKLRLLAYESRTNRPLLLDLINHYGFEIQIAISDPTGEFTVTPHEYLDLLAFAIRTPNQGLAEVTNRDLIGLWGQQHGASHEDWELNEELAAAFALSGTLSIGGLPAAAASLRAVSNTFLWVGDELIQRLDMRSSESNTDSDR